MMFEHIKPARLRNRFGFMKSIAQLSRFPRRFNLAGLNPLLGRIGSLEVRLITTKAELKTAQKLRYNVFYEEMSARADRAHKARKLDQDKFDKICDHLIVVDMASGKMTGFTAKANIISMP